MPKIVCQFVLTQVVIGVVAFNSIAARASERADTVFNSRVLPVLRAHCEKCHGATKRSGGLSIRTFAELLEGGDSGSPVVWGKADESVLLQKIVSGEMPPEGNSKLTKHEINAIREWIEGSSPPGTLLISRDTRVTQHQVIPIMLLRCTPCHGGRRREAELDLRSTASILKGSKSGAAVIPGNSSASRLIHRIQQEEMPPRRQLVSVSVKTMESAELQILKDWIDAGLPQSPVPADVATQDFDVLVSDLDRDFWSFKPLRPDAGSLPGSELLHVGDVQNPIDAIVLKRLQDVGLSLAPQADRRTLVRRVALDLTGIPPTPEEVEAFAGDDDPHAYERLVERLLASPRYGERWGRHWLDVAGYADSEGAQNEDRVRPNMWRYRDYVIRSFNADKPYDRFLHEQIAGDELAEYAKTPAITAELYDNLVATGFLRTAPDRTFANITNFVPDRLEVIADEIQILGSAVLGLTLHCARCHTHKFDPIPQRDYFRLAAALKDALDEHDWLGPDSRQLSYVMSEEREAWQKHEQEISDRLAPLKEMLKAEEDEAKKGGAGTDEAKKDEARKKELNEKIKKIEGERRPEPKIRALWSRGDPSPTYVLKRGNYLTPGAEVGPGVPSVLTDGRTPFRFEPPWPNAPTTGRRLALAQWLTSAPNPLTARVIVNRIWKHHFGRGIVTTLGNFGKTGAPPSHPELLDWLANQLKESGWHLKSLHRCLVLSRTYRQSSRVSPEQLAADPENRLLSRMSLRRVEAEVLRDSMLYVASQLNESPFGAPDDVEVLENGLVNVKRGTGGGRRSVYVLHRRTKLPTMLENFDSPQMGPNCLERGESIVALQALHLLNNAVVHRYADSFADRVSGEVGPDRKHQVDRIHRLAFGRPPDDEELTNSLELLGKLEAEWLSVQQDEGNSKQEAAQRALRNYCHAILNSAAFVFVD